jgi:hypothetical protein
MAGRVRMTAGSTPNTPPALQHEIYPDSADGRLKQIDPQGVRHILTPCGWRDNNVIINGEFDYAQRQAPGTLTTYSNTSGRAYGADRWGMTNENASIQYQRVDSIGAPETGLQARFYGKFKKLTSAGKMVVSQGIESGQMAHLRGRRVRVQAKMRFTVAASMTARLGLLYLTSAGTVDVLPATFVSAFGAVGTDPTWGTNLTALTPVSADGGSVSGLGINCVLTAAWVRYSATFDVPASCKNLIPVIWTNGQPAANDELNVTEVGLYDGEEIREWMPRSQAEQLLLCQRYYVKSFGVDVLPAQNVGVNSGEARSVAGKAGAVANAGYLPVEFPVTLFKSPTVTVFNPAAANALARNITGAADMGATAIVGTTASDFYINATGVAATAVGDLIAIHYTADAEI